MRPVISRPSPNHNARDSNVPVDMLVIHYTGKLSAGEALDWFCDPAHEVSVHYLIDEDGTVYQLVDEANRAWHAGFSFWRGQRAVNCRSIGIALYNPGYEHGYRPFPPSQMSSLAELSRGILARHPIPARNVVGHSDVAPSRHHNPGHLFDWRGLAAEGVGLWPASPRPADADAATLLSAWGYEVTDEAALKAALTAFQLHFRPSRHDGAADAETLGLLAALLNLALEGQRP